MSTTTQDGTWRDRAPKYVPADVRLMMSHPTTTTTHERSIHLEAETALGGDPLFRLEMTPDQFADLVASRAVVVRSVTPVAVSTETAPEGPLCTLCLTETVWNAGARRWEHTPGALTSNRSCNREEHRVTFAPQTGPHWLEVTLTATSNEYLRLPCRGRVLVNEYGTDGSAISVSFRACNPDGSLSAPVHVPDARWVYPAVQPV